MTSARIAAFALAVALAACSKPAAPPEPAAPAAATPAPAASPAAAPPAAARPALPEGACDKTEDGFASFLEAYIAEPDKRAAYTSPDFALRDIKAPDQPITHQTGPTEPFRIALVDYQWSYFEPGKPDGELARIKLDRKLEGDRMRLDFAKAEFSPDDEVVKTLGPPEAYVFEHKQGCWQLTLQLR